MTNTIVYHVGDVRDAMRLVDDGLVALVVTSPPFLELRSYLPADHPDKHREIGAEPTPAAFIDTLLALTVDWGRAIAPWGSIAVELGDTYSGSGGAGGDYNAGGLRDGQGKFEGSGRRARSVTGHSDRDAPQRPSRTGRRDRRHARGGDDEAMRSYAAGKRDKTPPGWPLAKSMCLVPLLYPTALAYGLNPVTGAPSPAGEWRVRNLLTWTRPNPPVGALGDKFRPATSFVTVATRDTPKAPRWFDLDAVRGEPETPRLVRVGEASASRGITGGDSGNPDKLRLSNNPAGAPPRDWWDANDLPDAELAEHWRVEQALADWQPLHRLSTSPYKGSHYATFPEALPRRLIEAMCPREVCTVCGVPRRRITERPKAIRKETRKSRAALAGQRHGDVISTDVPDVAVVVTIGWSDCGHAAYTPGIVLDPFGGSGTTGVAAARAGRDAILVDLDGRNRDLARARICEQLRLVDEYTVGTTTVWTVEPALPAQRAQIDGQRSIFDELEASA